MVETIYPDLNRRFNMNVTYLWLIILSVVDDIHIDSETLFNRLNKSHD
jgi:hypothetical protein